jgi:hypothetical protein
MDSFLGRKSGIRIQRIEEQINALNV